MSGTGNLLSSGGSRFFVLAIVLLLVCGPGPTGEASTRPVSSRLAVLVYHHLEDPATSDVSCTPDAFGEQMQALLDDGFTPLTLDQARKFLLGTLREVRRPVLITFDDGYASLHASALPVARRLRVPMTVFVVTGRMGRKPQFTRYLTGAEIREMVESGWFSFGSHTHDLHLNLVTILQAFHGRNNPVYDLLRDDLARSQKALRQLTGKTPIALAWPYGKHTPQTRQIARNAGFLLQFTSVAGYNEPGSDPFEIKRIPVTSRDTPASVLEKAAGW